MSSISFSLQYDKDQALSFNVDSSVSAANVHFLHSNRKNGPFVQENVSTSLSNNQLIVVIPKALIDTFGDQEYYQIKNNQQILFDGDLYVAIPKPLPEAMVTVDHISDAGSIGKSVLRTSSAADARNAIGAGVSNVVIGTTAGTAKSGDYLPSWTDVTSKPSTFTPAAHTHVANDVSDATATGKSLLTAATAAAARTAIGAGTSSIALGTTSATAKAGDYQPAVANISDATTIGKSILLAADASSVRSLTGAGTSNLVIGTTSTTAKSGDYVPAWNDVTSKPTTFTPSAHTHLWADTTDKPTTFTPSAHTHVIADVTDNVPVTKLSATGATTGQVLSYNGSAIVWTTPASGGSGTASDATTTAKGIVQLAGDLGGTADAPTVPTKASLTGAAFTGSVSSANGITAQNGTAAGTVSIGASASVPTVRLGTSSGPTITSSNTGGGSGGLIVSGTTSGATVLSTRGTVGQSANLQDWRIGTGTLLAYVDPNGKIVSTGGLRFAATTTVGQPVTAIDAIGTLGFGTPTYVQRVVTANYTVVAADAVAAILHSTSSTAVTVTVPDDTTVIPVEGFVRWRQYGAGQVTFAAASGVTIVSKGSLTHSAAQYGEGRLTKVAANTWLLTGDLA